MIVTAICIAIMGALAIPFIILARAESRMWEKRKAQGKPVPWI